MTPDELLLDGQQRMTSLYQACMREQVVETITPKNKLVKRWFYIDIQKACGRTATREEAIFAVPEDRRLKDAISTKTIAARSVRRQSAEYEQLMFPLNQVFDWDEWQEDFGTTGSREARPEARGFQAVQERCPAALQVLPGAGHHASRTTRHTRPFASCSRRSTLAARRSTPSSCSPPCMPRRAQAPGRLARRRRQTRGYRRGLPNSDARQIRPSACFQRSPARTFFRPSRCCHTKEVRVDTESPAAYNENDLPAVRATRQSLLDLPLEAYSHTVTASRTASRRPQSFSGSRTSISVIDLPYQTQLVPLAAIFAEIGDKAEHAGHMAKIARWYWCGIFGELYGGAIESRFAKDIVEVPAWLAGGPNRDGRRRRLPRGPPADDADPPLCRLQGHPCTAHARRRQRLPQRPGLST